jgi:hypothetical protein
MVEAMRDSLIATLRQPEDLERRFATRRASPPDDHWMTAVEEPVPAPPRPQAPEPRRLGGRIARLLRWNPDG